jgi:hypothetical protein
LITANKARHVSSWPQRIIRSLTIETPTDNVDSVMSAASASLNLDSAAERTAIRVADLALHATIFLVAFALVVSRRPDAIFNAQFYAEDGTFFYADAYHFGWRCLLMPYGGYLHIPLRLVGMLAQIFPFAHAPLVMNLCAIVVQILPVNIFLSSRFNTIPFVTRIGGGLLYLALPNAFEIHAKAANIQWHLALAACLVVLAPPDTRRLWRIFDFLVLSLFVFGSLMGTLLLPVAVLLRWIRKDARYNLPLFALIPGALVQGSILLFTESRRAAPNGATIARFADIIGGQVFFSSVLGVRTSMQLYFHSHFQSLFLFNVIALAIGLPFVFYALRHAPTELKLAYLFAGLVLASALHRPIASFLGDEVQWQLLEIPGAGNRYYFFPMLAFLATLIWMLTRVNSRFPRYSALAILLLLPIGICRDWRYKPFEDLHFQEYVAEFNRAAPGTQITIPLNPDWSMRLIKH